MNPISPTTLLVVKLELQQWNVVLAGLSEQKLKDILPLWQVLTEQLAGQTQALENNRPSNGGSGEYSSMQFEGSSNGSLRRPDAD
jgi:hypothetical protein